MTIQHKDLTGAQLHEPKGVETATSGQAYLADGLGSGAWTDPLSPINNLNTFDLSGTIPDASTASSNTMFYIPRDCTLTKIGTVMDATFTVANSIISLYKNGVLQGQTLTIGYSGSAKGVTDLLTLSPTYSFVLGDTLELRSDGGGTDPVALHCTCTFTV